MVVLPYDAGVELQLMRGNPTAISAGCLDVQHELAKHIGQGPALTCNVLVRELVELCGLGGDLEPIRAHEVRLRIHSRVAASIADGTSELDLTGYAKTLGVSAFP